MRRKHSIVLVIGIVWLIGILWGTGWLLDFSSRPGTSEASPSHWPKESRIASSENLPTLHVPVLVMFVHPHCGCSKASLGELNGILAHAGDKMKAYVVFVKPENTPPGWEKDSLWNEAQTLPGVRVILDEGGVEAKIFRADTSGHVLLYGADRSLWFSGGITKARGHSGDNAGKSAILALLENGVAERHTSSVFGCSLQGPEALGSE